tara:strand:+ start:224 stop:511 length:288 start_codon:yes stop_codon:yes gene_type:complete
MRLNHAIQNVQNHLVQKIRKRVSMHKLIYIIILFSFSFNYGVGDIVSISDQNVTKETCYAGNGYEVGDDWKLADWNGSLNGGHYNVIFIDMSTTW